MVSLYISEPYLTIIKLLLTGFIIGSAPNLAKYISSSMGSLYISEPYLTIIKLLLTGFIIGSAPNLAKYFNDIING